MHADEARGTREHRTDQEADGGRTREQNPCGYENDDTDEGDGCVLTREVGLRPLSDKACDFLHAGIPLVGGKHRPCRPDGIDHRKQPACDHAQ